MKLLSLLGLERPLRRLRIAAGEAAIAAEDRAALLRVAAADAVGRLKWMAGLSVALLWLTTMVVALLCVAIVVQYWDTPYRTTVAWTIAIVALVLWLASALGLWLSLKYLGHDVTVTRREFERDWRAVRQRFGGADASMRAAGEEAAPAEEPLPSKQEVLERIARQRERVAVLQQASAAARKPVPPDESATDTALRLAREHPVAAAAVAAGAVLVLRPRRMLRWAGWLLPVLWRMR